MGARSCTDRVEIELALALRRREFLRVTVLTSGPAIFKSLGYIIVRRITAFEALELNPCLGRRVGSGVNL